jgi:small subunit ribosomal protein S35
MDAIMVRRLSGLHEETDDEIMNELQMAPIDDVDDMDFENDFEEMHDTDNEIDDLYNARDHVMKKMVKDQYFNMDDKKWPDIVEDGVKHYVI